MDQKDKMFCELAKELGFISQESAQNALDAQKVDEAISQEKRIGAYLLEMGALNKQQIAQVIKMQECVAQQTPPVQVQPAPVVSTPNPNAKSRAVYVLLGLFLGGLGIHNFYAGYTGKAVWQLLLVILTGWLVIPLVVVGVWVIIEVCTTTQDASGLTLR